MEFSIAEIVKAPFEPRLQRSYRCAVSLTSSGFSVKVALSRAIKAYELLIFKIFMSSRAKKVRHRRGFERYKSLFTNKKAPEGTFLRSPLRAIQLRITGLAAILAFGRKNDHPGYPCGKAHWAFVTGVGPFGKKAQAPGSRIPPIRAVAVTGNLYQPCARLREKFAISILAEGTPYGAGSIWRRFRPLVWGEKPQDSRLDSGFSRKLLLHFRDFRHPWRSRRNDGIRP